MKHFSANGAFSSVRTDITLFSAVFCGQPLGAARAVSQVGAAQLAERAGTGLRRIAVPQDDADRARFVTKWAQRHQRRLAAGLPTSVLILAFSSMDAQAQDALIDLASVEGVQSVDVLGDGTVRVTFVDGSSVVLAEANIVVDPSGAILVTADVAEAIGAAGQAASAGAGGLMAGNGLIAGLAGAGAIAGAAGGGGGGGGGGTTTGAGGVPTQPQPLANGQVIDGYVANATVFRDLNANGILDAGEPQSRTDATGNFTGLGGAGGQIVAFGGVDISTGKAFTGQLTAPGDATVVTPLTTLTQTLVAQSGGTLTAAEAGQQVARAFGLADGFDVNNTDPVATNDLAALKAGAQVAAIISVAAAAAEDGAQATASDAVAQSLAQAITQANGQPVTLDATTITGALQQALGDGVDVAAKATALNSIVTTIENARDVSTVERVQSVAQGDLVDAIQNDDTIPDATQIDALIDAAVPLRPVILAAPDAVNAASFEEAGVTITGTGRAGAEVVVTFGTQSATATADEEGTWWVAFTTPPADGADVVIAARARIGDGPFSVAATRTVDVDATPPDAPTAFLAADTGAFDTDGITASGATLISGAEEGASVEYSIDGGESWTADFTAVEGANSVALRQTDAAGNISVSSAPLSFTLDTIAPDQPVIDFIEGDGLINAAEAADGVTITGTTDPNASVEVVWGETSRTVTANDEGRYSAEFTAAEVPADDDVLVIATATDLAGNTGEPGQILATIDTIAPVITLDDPLPETITRADILDLAGEPAVFSGGVSGVVEDTEVSLTLNGTTYVTTVDAGGAFRIEVPNEAVLRLEGLPDAVFSFAATDQVGNVGRLASTVTILGDLDGSDTVAEINAIAQAGTTTELAPLLASFAATRGIEIPEGMLDDLAGDVLLTSLVKNVISFTATPVLTTGGFGSEDQFSGSISFLLSFEPTSDLLRDAPNPVAVFQYTQNISGIDEQNSAGDLIFPGEVAALRLNETGVRMSVTEITQAEIDEFGAETITALFGDGVTIAPGVYTEFQIFISGAVGVQDTDTGEFTITGPEVSFSTLIPGEVGFDAFLNGLASGDLPLSQIEVQVINGRDTETGEDVLNDSITASVSFELDRTAQIDEVGLLEQLTNLITLRSALDAVIDAANAGELTLDLLIDFAAAIPGDNFAPPYLSGEQLSAAGFNAFNALDRLSPDEFQARLNALNASPATFETFTDLIENPVLFPEFNGRPAELPPAVNGVLDVDAVVDDVFTLATSDDVTLYVVNVRGDGDLGYEHWVATDTASGVVLADFAFNDGNDAFLRLVRGAQTETDFAYFQVIGLTAEGDTFTQNPEAASTVYLLPATALVGALAEGGTAGLTAAANQVAEISWADLGITDLPAGTIVAATQSFLIAFEEGASATLVVTEQFDLLDDTTTVYTAYLTQPLDEAGEPVPFTRPWSLQIPGEVEDFVADAYGNFSVTFNTTPDDDPTLVNRLVAFDAEGSPFLADPTDVSTVAIVDGQPTQLSINDNIVDIKTVIETASESTGLTVELFAPQTVSGAKSWVTMPDGKVAVTAYVANDAGVDSDWLVILNGDGTVSATVDNTGLGGNRQLFFPDIANDPEGVVFAVINLQAGEAAYEQPRGDGGLLFTLYRATPTQLLNLGVDATLDDLIAESRTVFTYSDLGAMVTTSTLLAYPELVILNDELFNLKALQVDGLSISLTGEVTQEYSAIGRIGESILLEDTIVNDALVLRDDAGSITDLLLTTVAGSFDPATPLTETATVFRFNLEAQDVTQTFVFGTDGVDAITALNANEDITGAAHFVVPGGTGEATGEDVINLTFGTGAQKETIVIDLRDTATGDKVAINGFDVAQDDIGLSFAGEDVTAGARFAVTAVTVNDLSNFTVADFGLAEGAITPGALNLFAVGETDGNSSILFGTANVDGGQEIAFLENVTNAQLAETVVVFALPNEDLVSLPT